MNNYYQKNIEAIKSNSNAFPLSVFSNLEKSTILNNVELIETKDKKLSAKIRYENKSFNLHSAYNPLGESEKLAEGILKDGEVNMIFLFGIGAGYLHRAIRSINHDINIAIIEPDYDMFLTIINIFPLDKIFQDTHTIFFIGENQMGDIETFIAMSATKKIKLATNRAYSILFYDVVLMYNQKIFDTVDKKAININTMGKFEKLWAYNISGNVDSITFHYGVNKFFDMFKGKPAIVVSAGPSLEKNIEKIKSMKEYAVIIAVDTALKPLQYHNIKPHFIISVDPQKKNSKYFRDVDTSESILIVESSIDREVIENHKSALYFNESIFPLAQLFMKYLGDRGEIIIGGSVSTGAFDFAIKLGCYPIIMVGLDLSFPDYQTHIKGSYHEEDFFTQINRLDTYDSRIYKILIQGNLQKENNIYGQTVYIDSRFQMYRDWYIKHIASHENIKVYNATEGGINLDGMENITFDEIAQKITEKIDFSILDFSYEGSCITNEQKIKTGNYLKTELEKMDEGMKDILPTIEQCIEISQNLVDDVKRHRNVDKIIATLNKLDEKIFNFTSLSPFISLTMQKTIKLVTEGYDLTDDNDKSLDKDMKKAMNSFILYTEMKKSVEFNRYIINRSISVLRTL